VRTAKDGDTICTRETLGDKKRRFTIFVSKVASTRSTSRPSKINIAFTRGDKGLFTLHHLASNERIILCDARKHNRRDQCQDLCDRIELLFF
jgi:hypothetical protein